MGPFSKFGLFSSGCGKFVGLADGLSVDDGLDDGEKEGGAGGMR